MSAAGLLFSKRVVYTSYPGAEIEAGDFGGLPSKRFCMRVEDGEVAVLKAKEATGY